jgi:hypothetical protein
VGLVVFAGRTDFRGRLGRGKGRSLRHPTGEVGDQFLVQLALGRHQDGIVLVEHGLEKQALGGLPRHDRWPEIAALKDGRTAIETEAALLLLRAVTRDAMLEQQRTNGRLEEADLLSRGLSRKGASGSNDEQGEAKGNLPHHQGSSVAGE